MTVSTDFAFTSRSTKHGYCCPHAALNGIVKGMIVLWIGQVPEGWRAVDALALRDDSHGTFIVRTTERDLPHSFGKKQ